MSKENLANTGIVVSKFRNNSLFYIYGLISFLYLAIFYEQIIAALEYPDALIIPIMSFGSFVAGSTFLGGGVIAFPMLTKVLGFDPVSAKIFSLAIQSVGMTSASIYIISKTPSIPYRFIFINIISGSIGLALSLFFFQKFFASSDIRLGFTMFVFCSLVIYIWVFKNNIVLSKYPKLSDTNSSKLSSFGYKQTSIVVISGFLGGSISGLIGSGADLLVFCILSLYFHVDLKNATKISIITMAAISMIGTFFQIFIIDSFSEELTNLWVLAAPVVLFGAPLGAMFLRKVKAVKLLVFIIAIVTVEVITTVMLVNVETWKLFVHFSLGVISIILLYQLYSCSPYNSSISN